MLEDTIAVGGCVVAAACMGLTTVTQNPIFDATGSIIIGLGLAKVAQFLVSSNMTYLLGRVSNIISTLKIDTEFELGKGQSIPHKDVINIQDMLEDRHTVRAVYDVKGKSSVLEGLKNVCLATYLGPATARLKAEVDFDGRQLAANYLEELNRRSLTYELNQIASAETEREVHFYNARTSYVKGYSRPCSYCWSVGFSVKLDVTMLCPDQL